MTASEILVVAGGLVIGFWGVTFLMRKREGGSFRQPIHPARPKPPDLGEPRWHEVLEITPAATAAEIREAYRRLMSQYHPDKVASAGAELQALAERKSKQIGEAYREAMRERGEEA